MNYRHIYHAGNFADVVKHLLLVLCLDHLRKKEGPFFVCDAHAGTGLYNLKSEQAQKTLEYKDGIEKLIEADIKNEDLALYLSAVRQDCAGGHYPGSPVIAARMLRAQDRMAANELHPEDIQVLQKNLQKFRNIQLSETDAYQAIRANIPPRERRGLVLIDPPFEKKDEFQALCGQIREWKKRWGTGIYMIWYPIKDRTQTDALYAAASAAGFKKTWVCEYTAHQMQAKEDNKLKSTGLLILNIPYQVPERMDSAMREAAAILDGDYRARWLVQGQ